MILDGVTVPLITPLNEDFSVDLVGLERTIEQMLAAQVQGIFILGSSGEYANLSRQTKDELITNARRLIGSRAYLYIGIARTSSRGTIEEGRHIQNLRIDPDAFVTLPPFYFNHSSNELVTHFRMIADELDVPIIMYNIPELVKHTLTSDVVSQLASHPKIIGIKNTSRDMKAFRELLDIRHNLNTNFRVSQGGLPNAVECLQLGADGITLGVASLAPRLCVQMYQSVQAGDISTANQILDRLVHIDPVGIRASWFAGLKYQCYLLGMCKPVVSQPFDWPGEEDQVILADKLAEEGLLQIVGDNQSHEIS